jgi:hypothetical protein
MGNRSDGSGDDRLCAAATSYGKGHTPYKKGAITSLSSGVAIERTMHKINERLEALTKEFAIEDWEDAWRTFTSYLQLLPREAMASSPILGG